MPRSGSTLLCNILNQNNKFWATATSGLCPLLLQTNNSWGQIPELRASATPEQKISTLRGMLDGYHCGIDREVIVNKSRGWVVCAEMLENILQCKPKILATIRDIPSILSSCEKLFRRELASLNSTAIMGQNFETLEGRLAHWTAPDQLVGGQYNRLRDFVRRGHRAQIHFVNFDNLTTEPEKTLREAYAFLDEGYFPHDFNNVEQSTYEKDIEHGFTDLHSIRQQVRPVRKDYREVLGDAARPYLNFSYDFIEK